MVPTWMELRIALRTLRRSKGFALFSVLALALAIAANTTMSSLIDGLIFPDVGFPHPERLVIAHFTAPKSPLYPNVHPLDVLGHSGKTYSGVTPWHGQYGMSVPIRIHGQVHGAATASVLGDYFTTLESRPLYGTLFTDSTAANQRVAVITESLWKLLSGGTRAFAPFALDAGPISAGDEGLLAVIGVVANDAVLPLRTELIVPYRESHPRAAELLIRMRPGVSRSRLLVELNAAAPSIDPSHSRFAHFELQPAIASPARDFGIVAALAATTLAVLLIACANIANLLLARGMSRQRELATRLAFGASRFQVARLLFAESGLVAAAGGACGLLLSLWTIHVVRATLPADLQSYGLVQPQLSWRVLAVGVGLTTVAAILFGLAPMVLLARRDVSGLLRGAGGRHATANRSRFQFLVVAEVAGALVLVVSAALLGASAARVRFIGLGYDASNLVMASAPDVLGKSTSELPVRPSAAVIARRYDETQRLAAMPGVAGVTEFWFPSLYGAVRVDDPAGGDQRITVGASQIEEVAPNFLRMMKIPVIKGRGFGESEDDPIPSIVIDETAAHWLWGTADPIGRLLQFGKSRDEHAPWMRVVGIIKPLALYNFCETGPCGEATILIANGAGYPAPASRTTFMVRATGSAEGLVDRLQRRLDTDYPNGSVNVATWSEALGIDYFAEIHNFVAALFGSFAIIGLLLALLGVYGVAAYAVERRDREFGVRIALGAQQRDIVKLVLRDGNATALLGLAAGLIVANWVTHLLHAMLFGFDNSVPAFLGVAVVALFAATVGAGVPAAVRAARVNPVDTLRSE